MPPSPPLVLPLPPLLLLLQLLPSAWMQANPVGRDIYRPLGNYPTVSEPTEPGLECALAPSHHKGVRNVLCMYTIDKMADASYNWQQASRRLHPTHQPRFTGSNRRVPRAQVSAGGRHTCGIKTGPGFTDGKDYTGRLFCFGRNEEKQCSVPADVADAVWSTVSAGALPPNSQPQTCNDNARGCRLEDDMRHTYGFTQQLNRFSVVLRDACGRRSRGACAASATTPAASCPGRRSCRPRGRYAAA